MDNRGLLYFPVWVQSKKLILGDTSFRRDTLSSPWRKYIHNGSKWLPYAAATDQLKSKMRLRQQAQDHNRTVRKTGV